MPRIEQIREMLADDPTDIFLRYALAMELGKEDDYSEALNIYEQLTKEQPPYVPAFFMAGQLLARNEKYSAARDYLRDGIEQARAQNDLHAAGEMSEFLTSLGEFGE